MKPKDKERQQTRFKVYDKVWVMLNNSPTELIVFAVVESMGYWKVDTEMFYHLVGSRIGAGWGNNEGARYEPEKVFGSKEELLESIA